MSSLPELSVHQLRACHIGGYWRGVNDMVRHMMLGLRQAGLTVLEVDTDQHLEILDTDGRPYDRGTSGPVWLNLEGLRRKADLESFAPHLIICNAGGLSFRPRDAARLRGNHCLLGIALSDPDVFQPATRHIAPHFDLFLTCDPSLIPDYQALGARAAVLPIGTNEEFFRPVEPQPEHVCDVLVLGRAHPDRVEPVKALVERFDTHLYGEGWDDHGLVSRGLIFGQEVLRALSSAVLTVVFFRTGSGAPLVKVGLFDFTAAGALVVTNHFPAVEQYLEYGKEIVGFTSTRDLLDKVAYYLDHPEEAESVRRAGRRRVLEEHTWSHAWKRILDQLRGLG